MEIKSKQKSLSDRQEILLESGTNEVEFLEFYLSPERKSEAEHSPVDREKLGSFAINVAKVKQILNFNGEKICKMPNNTEGLLGVFLWQNQSVSLYDLNFILSGKYIEPNEYTTVIITEFNNAINAFLTYGVNAISRVSWTELKPIAKFMNNYSSKIISYVLLNERIIQIVDFEKIVAELSPETDIIKACKDLDTTQNKNDLRKNKIVYFAEDSNFIREMVTKSFHDIGYTQLHMFNDGQAALDEINKQKVQLQDGKPVSDVINILVTDIEMPRMDGLTLCKLFKNDAPFSAVPVIMFSSLITPEMQDKCKQCGADYAISKPKMKELVDLVDKAIFGY